MTTTVADIWLDAYLTGLTDAGVPDDQHADFVAKNMPAHLFDELATKAAHEEARELREAQP